MKSAGKTIAAFCAVVFCFFAFLPGFLKSLFWGTMANNSGAREIIGIIEPLAVGSLLRNTLLIILIAASSTASATGWGQKATSRPFSRRAACFGPEGKCVRKPQAPELIIFSWDSLCSILFL